MALRAKPPEDDAADKYKCLVYAATNVGKSTFAGRFPKPYFIDGEKGTADKQYTKLIRENGGALLRTSDYEEVKAEVRALYTEQHDYLTLVIDPITTIYDDLLDKCTDQVIARGGNPEKSAMLIYGAVNRKMKELIRMILRLDMNVIVTAHSKIEYSTDGKMEQLGTTFDGYKKLLYMFDVALELQKIGKERWAIVKKTRKESFPEDERFPLTVEEIERRCGDVFRRQAVPVELATTEQVARLEELISELLVTPDTIDKWKEKEGAADIGDFSRVAIEKYIAACEKKLAEKEKTKEMAY